MNRYYPQRQDSTSLDSERLPEWSNKSQYNLTTQTVGDNLLDDIEL